MSENKKSIIKTVSRYYIWFVAAILLVASILFVINKIRYFLADTKNSVENILVVNAESSNSSIEEVLEFYHKSTYNQLFIITDVQFKQANDDSDEKFFTEENPHHSIHYIKIPSGLESNQIQAAAMALKIEAESLGIELQSFDIAADILKTKRMNYVFSKLFPEALIGNIILKPLLNNPNKASYAEVLNEFFAFLSSRFSKFSEDKLRIALQNGNYIDEILAARAKKDTYFKEDSKTPLHLDLREDFEGLNYFEPNPAWHFQSVLVIDTTEAAFEMPTTTDRLPLYRKYGYVEFKVNDSIFRLYAYQNLDFLKKDPKNDYLFIPFKDLTNTIETNGSGRYLDISIPDKELISIDFNKAYNPYCAYDDKYSCPIPPFENHLKLRIEAGEKKLRKDEQP